MTISTDAQLCYGIAFEEGTEFPWDEQGDINDWWLKVNGYKPTREIVDENGEYLGGVRPSSAELSAYFDERRAFLETHPLPVELVRSGYGEYPVYILAVPGTLRTASPDYPQPIDLAGLTVADDAQEALLEFCHRYGIERPDKPRWYLSSYWG